MTISPELAAILDAGLCWLYDTEQPDDAHHQHHGIVLGLPDTNRLYGFCPAGWGNRPVVSVDVAKVEYKLDGDGDTIPANPLDVLELDALAAELKRRGFTPSSTWNGHPGVTGSVGLARAAHPTLTAAVDRYRRGCIVHPDRGVFCDCEAWRAGYRRILQPTREEQPAAEEPAACAKCRTPFNPTDPSYVGTARHRDTAYCRGCVSRCHDNEIADHTCVICAPERTR